MSCSAEQRTASALEHEAVIGLRINRGLTRLRSHHPSDW